MQGLGRGDAKLGLGRGWRRRRFMLLHRRDILGLQCRDFLEDVV
jgi:hypothetical protein